MMSERPVGGMGEVFLFDLSLGILLFDYTINYRHRRQSSSLQIGVVALPFLHFIDGYGLSNFTFITTSGKRLLDR